MAVVIPQMIGKYKVEGFIAKGGMGAVYKALHPGLNRPVVIKKMLARGNKIEAARFEQEAKILIDMQCPYIVNLYDYFTEGSYRYMVEELVDGISCDKLVKKQGYLSPQVASIIMLDTCKGVKYAHDKGVVHRDIKSGNVLVSKGCNIKLADFGISSIKSKEGDDVDSTIIQGMTMAGTSLGTPNYMSPEQIEDASTVDKRSDIYSLGVMFYEFVTGKKPYESAKSLAELKAMALRGKYISPDKINPSVPRYICHMIKKMMAPKPRNRYQSVATIMKDLTKYLNHYDNHILRKVIAQMVIKSDVKLTEIEYKDLGKVARLAARVIVLSLIGAGLLCFAWMRGYIHRYVLRNWFTPVVISVSLPASSHAMDVPIHAFFFKDDNKDLPLVKSAKIQMSKFFQSDVAGGKVAQSTAAALSPIQYLTHGDYRVKLVAGSYVWWRSFTVSKKEIIISCDILKGVTRPLRVITRAYDYDSGEEITQRTKVEVNYKGLWTPIAAVGRDKLINNTVWKFRFSARGYQTQEYSLLFDWYQDEVHIGATLKKAE